MDYHTKYLKYKNKYLNLLKKNRQLGGMDKRELLKEYRTADPERKKEIMNLLYADNRTHYQGQSPQNIGQMVGFLESREPEIVRKYIAPGVYSDLLEANKYFDSFSSWLWQGRPLDINDMDVLNKFMTDYGVNLQGDYLTSRSWWVGDSRISNLRKNLMVLIIKLGFGRYVDVKKSPIEAHLKYLLKVRLSYFQNIINFDSFHIFLKLGGLDLNGVSKERINEIWSNISSRNNIIKIIKYGEGYKINLNNPNLERFIERLEKLNNLKYLSNLHFSKYFDERRDNYSAQKWLKNRNYISQMLNLGSVPNIDNYNEMADYLIKNLNKSTLEKLLTSIKLGLGPLINLENLDNLDEIIKTKIDEDKTKIGTPEYIEDGGNLLYELHGERIIFL